MVAGTDVDASAVETLFTYVHIKYRKKEIRFPKVLKQHFYNKNIEDFDLKNRHYFDV